MAPSSVLTARAAWSGAVLSFLGSEIRPNPSIWKFDETGTPPPPPEPSAKSNAEMVASGKKYCILLVEDNPADVLLVREALAEHGLHCDVNVMTDGEAAINFIQKIDRGETDCPELVILDLNLPRRSGHEVLQSMRASRRCSQTPVIILSSSAAPADRERSALFGSSLYFTKPSLIDEFLELGAVFKEILTSTKI